MSIALMAAAWKLDIPMTEKMVLLCLCDFANDEGVCWPSVDTIAGKCSCTDRTVQNAIKALKARGLLTTIDAPGKAHNFCINGRKIFTPENNSPPKTTTKGVKEIHHGGEPRSPKPSLNHQEPSKQKTNRARVISDDWQPAMFSGGSKCGEIMADWPPGEFETQVEHFTAYHRGKGSRFVDWQDAWKTWVLNSRKWNNGAVRTGKGYSGTQRPSNGIAAALDRRLGLGQPAAEAGRPAFGAGGQHRALTASAADPRK